MKALASLLVALALVFGMYFLYVKRSRIAEHGRSPVQTISVTGVQNDLLAIAQAERVYYVEHGAYASLDELASSGALSIPRAGRDGYTYAVQTSASGFTVTARFTGPPGSHNPTFTVDQTMQVRQVE